VAGLHICEVNRFGSDSRGEYVMVANNGSGNVSLTGLEISDYTATQQRPHVYRFPANTNGSSITLAAREEVYLFTGSGTDQWVTGQNGQRALLLFWGRAASVWNNTGDVAYLRHADGTLIDSMTVGDPKRHPNGH
jgi:Lamin Tail Domain